MKNFSGNRELIQEFSKTFNIGVVDICNFISQSEDEKNDYRFIKDFENGIKKLSDKYRKQYILVDTEYIKIERFEIDDYNVYVYGESIEFYDDCDYREEIELTYDSSRWLSGIESHVTTLEDIEKKIESRIVSVDEMKKIFNENFDAYRERFYHHMFGV
jgi:hypothetical protein